MNIHDLQVAGYRLQGRPREFQFDPGTGSTSALIQPQLKLLSQLHLDSGPYTLVLTAFDGGEPAALTGSTTVIVTVEDSNDHQPQFDEEVVKIQVGFVKLYIHRVRKKWNRSVINCNFVKS